MRGEFSVVTTSNRGIILSRTPKEIIELPTELQGIGIKVKVQEKGKLSGANEILTNGTLRNLTVFGSAMKNGNELVINPISISY
jgi:hypothetical protein